MKSSTRDRTEGKLHQAKGRIKQAVGVIAGDRDLESEGRKENVVGKVQEKLGEVKKVAGK